MKLFSGFLRDKYLTLSVLILFFLVMRLLILFSGVDNLIYDDELGVGTLAKVLIAGSHIPLFDYADSFRWGAGIIGILTVPFFLLFGESLVVLRIVAMFFSLGTLVLLYLFLYNFFNRKAAILASILFILSPPNYVKMSFVCWGGYTEVNFFTILTISLFYMIFFAGVPKKYLYAVFGAVSGLALFYDYIFLLTLACCLLFWFIFDKRFFLKKDFYIFLTSFLVGFSPWFYYNVTHGWEGLFTVRGQSLLSWYAKNNFVASLAQLKNLVTSHIPQYLYFKDSFLIGKAFILRSYYFIFIISFAGLFWLHRKSIVKLFLGLFPLRKFKVFPGGISRETLLIIYPIIFGLSYSFFGISSLPVEEVDAVLPHRFLAPLPPFLFMIASLFLIEITKNKYGVLISRIAITALIIIGLISNIGMISAKNFMISLIPQGYNYVRFGKQLRYRYGDDIGHLLEYIKKIDKRYQRFFYDGYEWAVPKGKKGFSVKDYIQKKVTVGIDKDYWPLAYENLGKAMGIDSRYSKNTDEELKKYMNKAYYPYFYRGLGRSLVSMDIDDAGYNYLIGIINKQYWRYFYEGIGREMDKMFIDNIAKFLQFMKRIDTESQKNVYIGFGEGREYREISYLKFKSGFGKIGYSIQTWEKLIGNIPDEYKPYCYQRLGIEIGWRFIHDIKRYLAFLQKADEKYSGSLYKGLGIGIGWRFGYDRQGCLRLIQEINPRYRPYAYEGLGIGVARRYNCRLNELTQDIGQPFIENNPYFYKGLREAIEQRPE